MKNGKTTIVRPLIKAIKKGTIRTDYQPVSKEPFKVKNSRTPNVLFNHQHISVTHITLFLNFNLLIDSIMDVIPTSTLVNDI